VELVRRKPYEYENEELRRAARRRIGIAVAHSLAAFADRLGRALVRLGTRLQAWAQPRPMDAHLAGAEE
jgi:hypothetical protein